MLDSLEGILGPILKVSLLHALLKYGFSKFAFGNNCACINDTQILSSFNEVLCNCIHTPNMKIDFFKDKEFATKKALQ